jgi:hypothetical protein
MEKYGIFPILIASVSLLPQALEMIVQLLKSLSIMCRILLSGLQVVKAPLIVLIKAHYLISLRGTQRLQLTGDLRFIV